MTVKFYRSRPLKNGRRAILRKNKQSFFRANVLSAWTVRNNEDTHNTSRQLARDSFVLGQQQVYTASWHWTRAVDEYFAFEQRLWTDSVKGNEPLVSEKQSVWKINTQKVINFRVLGISRSRHAHTRTRCVRFVTRLRKFFFFFFSLNQHEKHDKEFIVNCLSRMYRCYNCIKYI